MNGKSTGSLSGIVLLSHSINERIDEHRSREFAERVKFFAEHYGHVHIVSLNSSDGEKTCRASDTHKIYVTRLKTNSLRDQIRLYYILKKASVTFVDTESDIFHGLIALMLSRTRPILFFQGMVIDQFLFSTISSKVGRLVRPILRYLALFLEHISLRIPRDIICVSKGLMRHVSKVIGSSKNTRIHYLPHSLYFVTKFSTLKAPDRVTNAINRGSIILSYLGRLAKSKRVHVALKTTAVLLERAHPVVLVVMGTGSEKRHLFKLTKELGISENVIFTGHIDRELALSILALSRTMIFPSESEGFSWSVIESLAMGCPVVAYQYRTSKDDDLDQAVVLVNSFDPAVFSDEVEQILVNNDLYKTLVEKGLKFSKPYISITQSERFSRITEIIDSY